MLRLSPERIFRHIVQDKFGTSGRLETANRMAKATPGERHRAHRENEEVGVTQEEPGLWNVQSPVIDNGKRIGKRREAGVLEYPESGTFVVFRPAGRNDLSEGFWENGDVLLQEIGQSITFVREGCRRNLNVASGQTAL